MFTAITINRRLLKKISSVISLCVGAIKVEVDIFFGGNGVGAASSPHQGRELVSWSYFDRTASLGVSINAETAIMTPIGLNAIDGEDSLANRDNHLRTPSDLTPWIQEANLIIGHLLCQGIAATCYFQN